MKRELRLWWKFKARGFRKPLNFRICFQNQHAMMMYDHQKKPGFFCWSYCAILINSAGPVTHYTLAEILVSALWPGHRYIAQKFSRWPPEAQKFGVYSVGPAKVFGTSLKWPLPPLHFGDLRGPVTRYCRIDRNGTVCHWFIIDPRSGSKSWSNPLKTYLQSPVQICWGIWVVLKSPVQSSYLPPSASNRDQDWLALLQKLIKTRPGQLFISYETSF